MGIALPDTLFSDFQPTGWYVLYEFRELWQPPRSCKLSFSTWDSQFTLSAALPAIGFDGRNRRQAPFLQRGSQRPSTQAPVRPDTFHLASNCQEFCGVRRNLAVHSALLTQQCGRESLGRQLYSAEKSRLRCRVRKRTNEHVHSLGGIRGLHLLAAAPALVISTLPRDDHSCAVV